MRGVAIALTGLLSVISTAAAAQAPPRPFSTNEEVGSHVQRARKARDAAKWSEAEAAYEAALAAATDGTATDVQRAEIKGELGAL
jgi:hypothetical protein